MQFLNLDPNHWIVSATYQEMCFTPSAAVLSNAECDPQAERGPYIYGRKISYNNIDFN